MATRVEKIDVGWNPIGKRGYDALATAIRGGAAPKLKEFNFSSHESAALKEACEARGVEAKLV